MFGLGKLFYTILLLVNSVAVLSEDRFLKRIGLGKDAQTGFGGSIEASSTKSRIVHLISAIQTLLRIPLIVINVIVIIYELIFG